MTAEWGEDYHGRSCLIFRKSRGKISEDEVRDYIRKNYYGGTYVHMIDAEEEGEPQMFGDELDEQKGDIWILHEPDVIKQEIIERAEG